MGWWGSRLVITGAGVRHSSRLATGLWSWVVVYTPPQQLQYISFDDTLETPHFNNSSSSSMIYKDSNKLSWTQQTFIRINFQMLQSPFIASFSRCRIKRPLDPTVSLIPQETVLCSMINVLEALQHNANQVLWNVVICDKVSKTQKILKAAFKCIYWDNDH